MELAILLERGCALSRSPNVCAACFSTVNGRGESSGSGPACLAPAPTLHHSITPLLQPPPDRLEGFLQPLAALSFVCSGGWQPPRESGAAEWKMRRWHEQARNEYGTSINRRIEGRPTPRAGLWGERAAYLSCSGKANKCQALR
jgi:hypothetical protein